MQVEILTKDDIIQLMTNFVHEIKEAFNDSSLKKPVEEYLKSKEVCNRLKISPGKLQSLRINGSLKAKKIGGTLYYLSSDVEKLLQ